MSDDASKLEPEPPFLERGMRTLDQLMVWVGDWILSSVAVVVEYFQFNLRTFRTLPRIFGNFHLTLEQLHAIGISSIPLVATTSLFTGAVTAWQAGYLFAGIIPVSFVGVAVGK